MMESAKNRAYQIVKINEEREKAESQQTWEQEFKEYQEHCVEVTKKTFGGTAEQWEVWKSKVIRPFADRLWDQGCLAPVIKDFVASIKTKPGAKPSARRPFRLSDYNESPLEWRLQEFTNSG